MPWEHASLSKSHFLDELSALLYIFIDELFAFTYTFMDEHSNSKRNKHEENTKKDEENTKDTRNFAYFSSKQRTNHRAKTDRWSAKNQWAKLDHWNQRVKMTRWNQRLKMSLWSGWKPTTPLRAKMARGYKLYRRLQRGGTQKCHLVIFSKNLLTKSDLCVILL